MRRPLGFSHCRHEKIYKKTDFAKWSRLILLIVETILNQICAGINLWISFNKQFFLTRFQLDLQWEVHRRILFFIHHVASIMICRLFASLTLNEIEMSSKLKICIWVNKNNYYISKSYEPVRHCNFDLQLFLPKTIDSFLQSVDLIWLTLLTILTFNLEFEKPVSF